MSFINDLRRNYNDSEWRSTTVPEWQDKEGKPRVVYARDMTMRELRLVDVYGQKRGTTLARLVKLAQLKLCDADGRQLLDLQDIDGFEAYVEPAVLSRVLTELGLFEADEKEFLDDKLLEESEGN